ncbi:uncharacterized protein [Drosophila kikkawai]|uniref:DUF4729 domain-containing protein n=1 Tax=Drosophila kikkawai TaxID=30033 RepID=A0A6P4IF81_DROKI|nr:uncharacterized protein LOC108078304 [Drosophila kikkawai]
MEKKVLLDPGSHSIDDVLVHFEAYKRTRRQEQREFEQQLKNLSLNANCEELNADMEVLRAGLHKLHKQQERLQQLWELNAIDPAPLEAEVCEPQKEDPDEKPDQLEVANGESQCVYHNCQRRIDNQLLLLHYLCDHNQADSYCLSVLEGERAVLSFQPQSCVSRVNKVLGLLAYGGQLEQQLGVTQGRRKFYNAFLPDQHTHLETHIPVVVLICQTAALSVLESKKFELPDSQRDTIFVIWLVTPSDCHRLNATLSLCGRDAAARTGTVIGVRQVNDCQDTACFVTVDANYWRLTYTEMERLSNQFRDELHLEIGLTEPKN